MKGRYLQLTAGLMGVRGHVQRQGIVVHVIAEDLVDLTALLRSIGGREDGAVAFPVPIDRGDAVRGGGGPDRREVETPLPRPRDIYIPDLALGSGIKVPTRNLGEVVRVDDPLRTFRRAYSNVRSEGEAPLRAAAMTSGGCGPVVGPEAVKLVKLAGSTDRRPTTMPPMT